jgi:methionine-rich copper-binding protein CopC
MKRLILSLSLIGLLFVSLAPVLAHAALVRSDPPAGATVDRAPSEVFVWFSEQLSTGSKLTVFDSQFQAVDKGETFIDASDATLMRVQLAPLGPGRYTVNWKASAIDGHVSSGSFDFFVRDADLSPLVIAAVAAATLIALGIVFAISRSRARNRSA